MSREIRHAVEIAAPAERAWSVFCDLATWPRWFPTLERVERPGSGPFRLGEELVLHLAFRGRGAPVKVRVEELGLERVRWVGRSFGVTGDHAFFTERVDEGRCRFASEEVFSGFPVRLIPGFLFAEIERETVAGLERFRRLVET